MPPTQLSVIRPSPAFHPSPKRKRDQPPPFVPLLNTSLHSASTPPKGSPTLSGADSPRNVVADQLRGMTIAAIPMSPLTPTDDLVRKKPKLAAMREDSLTSLEDFTDAQLVSWELQRVPDALTVKISKPPLSPREIPETPQAESSQPQPRTFSELAASAQPTIFGSPTKTVSLDTSPSEQHNSKSRAQGPQPRPRNKSPSPPLASLTWQDNEITGHLVDPRTDPEDDGTGLNGIGFRPTAAIAHARAQRRKQQLMDWRAREAKEARAKRSERRRRGVGGTGRMSRESTIEREAVAREVDAAARRAVRFAV